MLIVNIAVVALPFEIKVVGQLHSSNFVSKQAGWGAEVLL